MPLVHCIKPSVDGRKPAPSPPGPRSVGKRVGGGAGRRRPPSCRSRRSREMGAAGCSGGRPHRPRHPASPGEPRRSPAVPAHAPAIAVRTPQALRRLESIDGQLSVLEAVVALPPVLHPPPPMRGQPSRGLTAGCSPEFGERSTATRPDPWPHARTPVRCGCTGSGSPARAATRAAPVDVASAI